MDLSYLQQWGLRDGGSPAGQWLANAPDRLEAVRQQRRRQWLPATGLQRNALQYAAEHRRRAGQAGPDTPANDYPERQNTFAQFTYTHALPDNKVSVTVGQYPFSNFDGNQYLASRQQNFNNYVLAQNGSATYALAGLGAYIQVNATSAIQFAAGLQSANNVSGSTLSTRHFGDDGYSWFGYAPWTAFKGLGAALNDPLGRATRPAAYPAFR